MAPSQSSDLVLVDTPAEGTRVISFNRVDKRNALSQSLISTFLKQLGEASTDSSVRVIIITGSKSCFSAGADIKEISELDAAEAGKRRYLEDLCLGIKAVRKPILAAIEGIALGGGFEVALMAMEMILLGRSITASEAHSNGLVSEVFDDGTVLDNTITIAEKLANSSEEALSFAKQAICAADDLGRNDELERRLYYTSFGTADKREGISAFLEKRKPRWARASGQGAAEAPRAVRRTPSNTDFLKELLVVPRTIGRAALGKEIARTGT
ncbi:hypothetical protein DL766_000430 [Monosporascus sp. MC13-8B]|uniref:Enoyl-CoA hydratase n=1 Tax=Monosporascus cannonballus TaxID=155416 RepID=A0ABY0HFY0_9PEZI|nr:hypothetical protein DL762_003143 [Monosporascus cannonballus]RYO98997.1 hypothetical protein DL763_001802 [Monosporascus cannonballus]RYP39405.1 hypothetical protein DL766_000430 [Monosporascus sp. MC13-8B]